MTLDNTGYNRISRGGDAVLWKSNAEGTTLWAVRSSGFSDAILNGVAVDGTNAVVAAGYFESSATFGGVVLTSSGFSPDAVLWKQSGEGTTLWAVRGGGSGSDDLYGVAVDGAGAVVAAGYSRSSAAMFGDVALNNVGWADAISWKLSSEGTTLWAVSGGGTDDDILYGVAVDGAGAVVAAGQTSSGPSTFGGVVLATAGGSNGLVWKVRAFIKTFHIFWARDSCFLPIGAYFERRQFVHVPSIFIIPRSTGAMSISFNLSRLPLPVFLLSEFVCVLPCTDTVSFPSSCLSLVLGHAHRWLRLTSHHRRRRCRRCRRCLARHPPIHPPRPRTRAPPAPRASARPTAFCS